MRTSIPRLLAITILLMGGLGTLAQPSPAATGLAYNALTQGPVPIPPSERSLQTATATPWSYVSREIRVLEGAIFDDQGNLLFCDVTSRRVLRLTPDKKLSTIVTLETFAPGGLAFHNDGRLFIAALDLEKGLGTIIAAHLDSAEITTIIPPGAGYLPNDLAFDAAGGFYFTDFKGTARAGGNRHPAQPCGLGFPLGVGSAGGQRVHQRDERHGTGGGKPAAGQRV